MRYVTILYIQPLTTCVKNDLDLDFFCREIIHAELIAITSVPVTDPDIWAFVSDNDHVFGAHATTGVSPNEWLKRGELAMREELKAGPDPKRS
jgi:hypothetical protein